MRIISALSWFSFLAAAGALLAWRPAAALALGVVFGAVALWRQKAPVRAKSRTVTIPAEPVAAPEPAPAFTPDPVLVARVEGAGWTLEPATRGAPWLVAVRDGVRIALRPFPNAPQAGSQDVMEALSAKRSEKAQYAAVICRLRPEDHVAERAKAAQVHMINLARLDAYLTLAASYRPPAAQPVRQPAMA